MSFTIGTMPQSIYQPLGLANLPEAELSTLSFENYQQKQEQALKVDPAVEARKLQAQRAEDKTEIHEPAAIPESPQSSAPLETLQSLFQRQQLMASIAAGEHSALQALIPTGQDKILGTATLQNPAGSVASLEKLVGASGTSGGQLDIETMMAARYPDTNKNNTPADPATQAAEAKAAAEDQRKQAAEDAALERKQNSEEIKKLADEIRNGKNLAVEEKEDADSTTSRFARAEHSEIKTSQPVHQADAYRAAIEKAAAQHQSLSERFTPQPSDSQHSALAQQIRTDNFISDIQNMQVMQFGTVNGNQLSTAA